VSQPANPSVLSNVNAGRSAISRMSVSGTTVYVLSGTGGVQLIDASNPAQPQVLDRGYFLSGIGLAHVAGTVAYLANGPTGLQLVDLSDPARPQPLDHAWTEWDAYAVRVSGGRAYVLTQGDGFYYYPYKNKIEIFDVSDPAAIQAIGSYRSEMFYHDIEAVGDRLYVAGNQGIEVVDVSDPAAPVLLGARRLSAAGQAFRAYDIEVQGERVYAATTKSLMLLDAATPASIGLVWEDETYEYFMAVDVVGSIVYGSGNSNLFTGFDIGNPAQPAEVGPWALEKASDTLHVSGSLVFSTMTGSYGLNPPRGLVVSDISNHSVVRAPTCAALPATNAIGFVVNGNHVLVSANVNGFQIYDFTFTPGTPNPGREIFLPLISR